MLSLPIALHSWGVSSDASALITRAIRDAIRIPDEADWESIQQRLPPGLELKVDITQHGAFVVFPDGIRVLV